MNSIGNDIQNWGGSQGAICADFFINRWVGISAFFIAIFIGRVGLKLMNVIKLSVVRSLAYTCALIIICSLSFGFLFRHIYEDSFLFLGGYHGYYATLWLEAKIGWPGTLLLILSGILLLLIAFSRRTIPLLRTFFRLDFIRKKKTAAPTAPVSTTENDNPLRTEMAISVPEEVVVASVETTPVEPEPERENPYATEENADELVDDSIDINNHSEEIPYQTYSETEDSVIPADTQNDDTEPDTHEPVFTIEQGVEEVEAQEQNELDEYDPTLDLSYYKAPHIRAAARRQIKHKHHRHQRAGGQQTAHHQYARKLWHTHQLDKSHCRTHGYTVRNCARSRYQDFQNQEPGRRYRRASPPSAFASLPRFPAKEP